jgi:hypothetical protein
VNDFIRRLAGIDVMLQQTDTCWNVDGMT